MAGCYAGYVCKVTLTAGTRGPPLNHLSRPRDARSKNETLPVMSFKEGTKVATLVWHIQHQHPQDYDVLLSMAEEELNELSKEISRVGG